MDISTSLPPGPKSMFGAEGLALRRDALRYLTDLARRYGDIVHFRVGQQRFILLNHPDHIRDVLVANHESFSKGGMIQRTRVVAGEGLFTSEGQRHRRQRHLIQPAFHRQRLAALAQMIVGSGEEFAESWIHNETREMLPEMRRLALEIIARTLFGPDADRDDARIIKGLAVAIGDLSHFGAQWSRLASVFRKLSRADSGRIEIARERLDAIIYPMIAERRRGEIDHADMLSTLMWAQDEAGGMSDVELRDEIVTMIEAGHVTTGNALTWTWYLLACHPAVEARLHQELDELLQGRPPTFEDLSRLTYADKIIWEALRIYPPAWMLRRRVLKDYAIGEFVMPADTQILMSPYLMHRDARYYPNPHQFDPERWTPEARASRPAFSYFPFGHGPRRCIGEGMAILEGILLLATLARRWRARLTTMRPPKPLAAMTLIPDTMALRLEKREVETGRRGDWEKGAAETR